MLWFIWKIIKLVVQEGAGMELYSEEFSLIVALLLQHGIIIPVEQSCCSLPPGLFCPGNKLFYILFSYNKILYMEKWSTSSD